MRRAEIGFGGFEAWTEQVYEEEARNAQRLEAKLKIEEHWLLRGVTARRARNEGRKAKLMEMRAQRAAMIAPQGAAKLVTASDDTRTKVFHRLDQYRSETAAVIPHYEKRSIVRRINANQPPDDVYRDVEAVVKKG